MPKLGRGEGQAFTLEGQTAVAAADFALGAGWGGSTITDVRAGSSDQAGQITITCATGGGLAQATATITLTFKSAFPSAPPVAICTSTNDNALDTGSTLAYTCSTTALVMTFPVLPVNTKVYIINYLIPGR